MKRGMPLLIAAGAVFVLLLIAFAGAAKEGINDNASDKEQVRFGAIPANESAKEAKNMTYGQCVSALTDVKDTCYDSVKAKRDSCVDSANDSSVAKQCKNDYKKDKDACKKDFKDSKQTCKQYKKTFWDKVRFWR